VSAGLVDRAERRGCSNGRLAELADYLGLEKSTMSGGHEHLDGAAVVEAPLDRRGGHAAMEVLAAGLDPRVRFQADGSHYTTTGELPLVPGIDGVVRDPKGRIRYSVLDNTCLGTMAERTVIDLDRSVVLPNGIDPVQVAAAMNPAMSSWVALRRRIDFRRGQGVLVLGATGNAGRVAIQVAKRFGAGRVAAAGRDTGRLAGLHALGADATAPSTSSPGRPTSTS
jgi:NADPH:quinone reductase-like Zn-dependent oxidoreductase